MPRWRLRPRDINEDKETKRSLLVASGLAFGIMMSFGSAAHAQQADIISGGIASLYRPDNQAKQKEAFTGDTCVIETGTFPYRLGRETAVIIQIHIGLTSFHKRSGGSTS